MKSVPDKNRIRVFKNLNGQWVVRFYTPVLDDRLTAGLWNRERFDSWREAMGFAAYLAREIE